MMKIVSIKLQKIIKPIKNFKSENKYQSYNKYIWQVVSPFQLTKSLAGTTFHIAHKYHDIKKSP